MRWCVLLALGAPAAAEVCPPADPQVEAQAALIDRLQRAPGEAEARVIQGELWRIWLAAPDVRAQELLDEGMSRRELFDFAGADRILTELIAYCPAYAEGWNQRAFARFLAQDFEGALSDLNEALLLSPAHVGALSGKALTLFSLGRDQEGQAVLRDAVALNPWLSERHLLQEPPGEEL